MTTPAPANFTFTDRHIGPDDSHLATMLDSVGYASLDALTDAAVPKSIALTEPLGLPEPLSEPEVLADLRRIAGRNRVLTSMIGQGYYDTITPAVIRRGVLENPAWYTAYTPYQPEISQGRLEALLNFQTLVSDLTGLPVAGASLLDEATAVAEAVALMFRSRGRKLDLATDVVVIDADVLPTTIAVVTARAEAAGQRVIVADLHTGEATGWDAASLAAAGASIVGLVLAHPGASGAVRDLKGVIADAKAAGALVTFTTDLLALTLLVSPGELGADIAVGSSQRLGVPMFYGGPHAAFIATSHGLERQLPGRLVGVSVDADGAVAYRLALQTREQHIRRERATSNICTAQALLAITASMYAVYHGPQGLRSIAERVQALAGGLAAALRALELPGIAVADHALFDTVRISAPGLTERIRQGAAQRGINVYVADSDHVQIAFDEVSTAEHVATVLESVVAAVAERTLTWFACDVRGESLEFAVDGGETTRATWSASGASLPSWALRGTDYLTHPTFNSYRSETAMMRYLRRLADKDLALDRTMIPLGSCTMKLNAAVEMEAISWPEFAQIHPLAPADQTEGYAELIEKLTSWLSEITGYAGVSVQPNAGSQGEFAGLLAIRKYHEGRGEPGRSVCLIPASAHGTNAASAAMAGLSVVVIATAEDGSIDLADLRAKVAENADRLAAIMLTYPSTHGVYEEHVREVCDLVHEAGGQVYIDGANLNALVGLAKPGQFGGDVSHLNLHKTFAIPHGGGGPGVGPVAVAEHLLPYLPGDPSGARGGDATAAADVAASATAAAPDEAPSPISAQAPPVSAAQFGSAGVLPISYAYIALMGADLRRSSQVAVLSANYLARRLEQAFPVLYTGPNGLVAHECILDLRAITAATKITAEDVAKRLIDYGFHAPTLSFPVAGTLMVEPTESEDLAELDRFIDAMLAIRAEIAQVEAGEVTAEDSVLRAAPHTAESVTAEVWEHSYTRTEAAYPVPALRQAKYWPPVRRIDGAYGDRNLVCSCPPLSHYAADGDA
ncbi:aminomethyl-transferring glycine dehydrogenase [Rarobacter faecitabidus]|uniref:Glycine dehydrogenase (decarboxylating) n=1 Tax=Rarobacter faecitabidus TaxID=13243 RepID=A0A542ZAA3_RARFA|nr:aminomethyl-transferring glycine dehydrogenase [Rarobacter faecitabidus]TQL57245.1 glycine dehydrogenase (decarboxylating) alpha subunit /glycine dehydrogenase (decarboxylating) beta subunit [Rarobacter faecitabidus]